APGALAHVELRALLETELFGSLVNDVHLDAELRGDLRRGSIGVIANDERGGFFCPRVARRVDVATLRHSSDPVVCSSTIALTRPSSSTTASFPIGRTVSIRMSQSYSAASRCISAYDSSSRSEASRIHASRKFGLRATISAIATRSFCAVLA